MGISNDVYSETVTREKKEPRLRLEPDQVLRVLNDYCGELSPGDLVPPHQELMKRFDASERAVRWALDELRREGKIVRRRGARTFIADKRLRPNVVPIAAVPTRLETVAAKNRTVVALAVPDGALFDQAMKMLVEQAKFEDISVVCHLLSWDNLDALPSLAESPLGYIIFRRDMMPLAEQLQAAGNRVVLIGTPFVDTTPAVPAVYGNQEHGGYFATKHLVDLGHRRIAFCAFGDYQQTLRWQGHQRALRDAARQGLEMQDSFIDVATMPGWKDDPAPGHAIFRSPSAPTALTVWNDHEAAMVVGQLNRLGLRVPQDVSIVGYDNLREGQTLHPELTTVHSPMDQQLQTAINLLTAQKTPTLPFQLLVQPSLICRESAIAPSARR